MKFHCITMEQFKQLHALGDCNSCFHPFCDENGTYCSLKTPIKSKSCDHVICQLCLLETSSQNIRFRRQIDCPCCFAPSAFRVSSCNPETALRIGKALRSNLIQVHRQPWCLSLAVYPYLMERIGRLLCCIVSKHDTSKTKNFKIRDRIKRLSVSLLFDMIHGLVQVHDFKEESTGSLLINRRSK